MDVKEIISNEVYNKYKKDARRRGIEFNLTRQDIAATIYLSCFYCGDPPSNDLKYRWPAGRIMPRYNGIDRIDNTRGYRTDNIKACCWPCNQAKAGRTLEEWSRWVRRIAERAGAVEKLAKG